MTPADHYKDREQTYIKHIFLRQYLERVAYHIGYFNSAFVYVDCFSGPWQASDEELADTSVRIALDILNRVQSGLAKQDRSVSIQAVFVERSGSAFKKLEGVLTEHCGVVQTRAIHGTFEDSIPAILNAVGPKFAFFFIDPTGWTGFAMDNLRPILQRRRGEVMVNLMYDFINRFLTLETEANEESLDRLFGTPRWREIRNAQDREAAMVDLYVQQLRSAGEFRYATWMRVLKPLSERTYFYLVYATRNGKGIDEFRAVEEKVVAEQDNLRQEAQRSHRVTRSGQTELAFSSSAPSNTLKLERDSQVEAAARLIDELLHAGPMLFGELRPLVLELPLVRRSDVMQLLRDGQSAGKYRIEGMSPRERTPKDHHRIILVRS